MGYFMCLEGTSDVADDVLVRGRRVYQQESLASKGTSDLTRLMGVLGLGPFSKTTRLDYLLLDVQRRNALSRTSINEYNVPC